MLELSTAKVSITGPAGGILGDICIAPGGSLAMSGDEFVTGTVNLGDGASRGSAKARNQRQAHEALLADQTYFHTLSVWENAQNGNQAGVAEIRRFQTVARLMQHMVSSQADKFELWQQLFLLTTRQAKQYLIMNVISVTIAAGCPRAGPCRRTNGFLGHWRLLAARCCLILQGTVTQWARRKDARRDCSSLLLPGPLG